MNFLLIYNNKHVDGKYSENLIYFIPLYGLNELIENYMISF